MVTDGTDAESFRLFDELCRVLNQVRNRNDELEHVGVVVEWVDDEGNEGDLVALAITLTYPDFNDAARVAFASDFKPVVHKFERVNGGMTNAIEATL